MLTRQKQRYIIALLLIIAVFLMGCTPGRMNTRSNNNTQNSDQDEVAFQDEEFNGDSEYSPIAKSESSDDEGYEESDDFESSYNKNRNSKYFQKGVASWYGREFHGNKTASGERFNMHKLTAAHRTLPFGTVVKVKNLSNNKSVNVLINDRGPYKDNRVIDLSYGAAKEIGMIRSGKANVGIVIMRKGQSSNANRGRNGNKYGISPASDDYADEGTVDGHFSLQAGAFYSKRNADRLKQRVEYLTESSAKVIFDGDMYKVRIDGITSKNEISRYKRLLMEENIPSYTIDNSEY